MKITIYELLGLIKDGKVPKKVKYEKIEWEYNIHMKDYQGYDSLHDTTRYLSNWVCFTSLNDEVEILDEEDEFIDIKELTSSPEHYIENAINDLIKNQKKIINKLKEEGK